MSVRFTVDGSDRLEQHLADVCEHVRAGVGAIIPRRRLEGLVLAGGYGRGEGGVLVVPGGDAPYNDLEFFVFVRGSTLLNDRRYRAALHLLGEQLTAVAGIEVEFKILSLAKFRRSAPSMFYYDLVMGHRWLIGDDALFAGCEHHRDASRIPLHEAARLLFNRCSGLLYAKERLLKTVFSDEDADFVGRNIAKAWLASGDVWLAGRGAYHWSCVERLRRLRGSDEAEARSLVPLHEAGVAFKLHPRRAGAEDRDRLQAEHAAITARARGLWLELEGRRLRKSFGSPLEYAGVGCSLCPETSMLRNVLCNLRASGLRGVLSRFGARYPRERLMRALPLLLWGAENKEEAAVIVDCLQCDESGFTAFVRAYETLWHRFN